MSTNQTESGVGGVLQPATMHRPMLAARPSLDAVSRVYPIRGPPTYLAAVRMRMPPLLSAYTYWGEAGQLPGQARPAPPGGHSAPAGHVIPRGMEQGWATDSGGRNAQV